MELLGSKFEQEFKFQYANMIDLEKVGHSSCHNMQQNSFCGTMCYCVTKSTL